MKNRLPLETLTGAGVLRARASAPPCSDPGVRVSKPPPRSDPGDPAPSPFLHQTQESRPPATLELKHRSPSPEAPLPTV